MTFHFVERLPTPVGVTHPETSIPASEKRSRAFLSAAPSAWSPPRRLSTPALPTAVLRHQSIAERIPSSVERWSRTFWAVMRVEKR